ncbi:A disintegrin and metalloproteinase with thrombospondin motifs like [Littorina saxatilis]|uniref:A disintegrin and metalloproteinase with thrombospondin motifs like n=1 Tax=Littorina saxatilis TaxID=31220 RepID=UPI0038B467C5
MVMVDVKTYSKFNYDPLLLEDYILHFWQVVNLRLRAIINPRLQLRIRSYGKILFSGFQQFIESSRVSIGGEPLVSLSGVIEGFRGWMHAYETNSKYAGHDVAILMTGENLCKLSSNGSSCSDSPKGIGYMGGACITSRRFSGYTYNVAVAEVDRSFRGVLTATHELGHLLNVSHDGEGTATACGRSSGYIMSYTWTDSVKFNQFSPCSKLSMSDFLTRTWYSDCLKESSESVYAYRGQLPGRIMSLQEQCMHYNAGIPCSSKPLDSQCHNLCCENILEVSVSSEPAADGTSCGQEKSCFAGRCAANQQLPTAPPLRIM